MIFNITMALQGKKGQQLMPFNYHYPLSAAIHGLIRKSNAEFATFFHDVGYGQERFKYFTFSDITVPFTSKGDQMLLLSERASFKVCFHLPAAAQHFITGLFMNQLLEIGDRTSPVRFAIQNVDHCDLNLPALPEEIISVVVQPISPLVIGITAKERFGSSTYYSPYEKIFVDRLIFCWIQKYRAISCLTDLEAEELRQRIKVGIFFFTNPPTERRITIKDGQYNAQKIRGYTKFRMRLTAPVKMIELALNGGMGNKNSIGMGCVQLIN